MFLQEHFFKIALHKTQERNPSPTLVGSPSFTSLQNSRSVPAGTLSKFHPTPRLKSKQGHANPTNAFGCVAFSRSVPAGTLSWICILTFRSMCSWRSTRRDFETKRRRVLQHVRSVPAGTLDTFCTQFTLLHSTSSLHFNSEAQYAATSSASPHN